jgi:hypothetical protein
MPMHRKNNNTEEEFLPRERMLIRHVDPEKVKSEDTEEARSVPLESAESTLVLEVEIQSSSVTHRIWDRREHGKKNCFAAQCTEKIIKTGASISS